MARNWRLSRRQKTLQQRANIVQSIRLFFIDRGFLEVETPHRIPAPAPESHIDAVSSGTWFLHPSPELCMKRLLAAGYGKIFQICRCWREGERGRQHVPEFTLLEWYRAGDDYQTLMEDCETLIQTLASKMGLGQRLTFHGQEIDLAGPWERLSVCDAFRGYSKVPMKEALELGHFDGVMVQEIEPRLGMKKPTFLYDYPAERGTLARLRKDDPSLAERFELYMGGLELANAFSELVDPEEQRERFLLEQANRRSLGKPVYPMPEPFLDELEEMPPSAGIALGVDRLVMVFLNAATIDDVVAFTPEEL
jgi:elongation factor P--(R)-beta-lysine ligase